MGVGGHGVAGHFDVASHHLRSSREDGRLFRCDTLDFDNCVVMRIDPEGAFNQVGRFVTRGYINGEAIAALDAACDAVS